MEGECIWGSEEVYVGKLGKVEGGEIVGEMYYMREEPIF